MLVERPEHPVLGLKVDAAEQASILESGEAAAILTVWSDRRIVPATLFT